MNANLYVVLIFYGNHNRYVATVDAINSEDAVRQCEEVLSVADHHTITSRRAIAVVDMDMV